MSQVQLPTMQVIAACEKYIARRKQRIEDAKEKCIISEMAPRWLFKPRTREQAIAKLKEDMWSEYNLIGIEGGYWARKVYDLLKLAKAAHMCGTDKVTVTDDVIDSIMGDLKG